MPLSAPNGCRCGQRRTIYRPEPMTFGNMRENGVRSLFVSCAHFGECGQGIRLIADASPREAGQQSDDAGQCVPSTMVIRSGLYPGVKWGALGAGFAQALAGESEAMGVVHEAVEDGVGNGRIGDHIVPMLHIDLAGDDG